MGATKSKKEAKASQGSIIIEFLYKHTMTDTRIPYYSPTIL